MLGRFEQELYRFIESSHPAILTDIREKKAIDDELKGRIEAALKEFKGRFTV